RLLEHHADQLPHLDRIDVLAIKVLTVINDGAIDTGVPDQIVHAVEAPDHRALAAAGRSDERRDAVAPDVEADLADGRCASVADAEIAHLEDRFSRLERLLLGTLQ